MTHPQLAFVPGRSHQIFRMDASPWWPARFDPGTGRRVAGLVSRTRTSPQRYKGLVREGPKPSGKSPNALARDGMQTEIYVG